MGYSYFCPRIVFGFHDLQCGWGNGTILESESLPIGIEIYAGEINKGFNISPIIGIECRLDTSGHAVYDPAEYTKLMEFNETCKRYYATIGISADIIERAAAPSFRVVISGDWDCRGFYTIPNTETSTN
jgi:hypothetical protein